MRSQGVQDIDWDERLSVVLIFMIAQSERRGCRKHHP